MQDFLYPALAVVAAYLLGSLSFAIIVSRTMGLRDPRSYGSGNPGATNVLRSGSKGAAVLTLVLDAAKGWLAVALVRWFGEPYGLGVGTIALVGLAVFLGHLFPVFFRFKGGKGVATAVGVLLGYEWLLALCVIAVWALLLAATRYVSLASMVAAIAAPFAYMMVSGTVWNAELEIVLAMGVMALLICTRHAANIQRLIAGQEPRLGGSAAAGHAPQPVKAPKPARAAEAAAAPGQGKRRRK